jgi:hypothetical protein
VGGFDPGWPGAKASRGRWLRGRGARLVVGHVELM